MNDQNFFAIGAPYQPPDMAFYKRAVLRPAPPHFNVDVLAPVKQGNAHSYGLRILPTVSETETFSDALSIRSTYREYTIWRRWEDLLDFQEKLEREYDTMSREKRRLLQAGRNGKKTDGVYLSSANAASFESLPEGPDPKSVTFDVHKHLPKLSTKTTFFRVSDATIKKRAEEFAALIEELFKPEQVQLIRDLRRCPVIRDFFGWWRRDKELAAKQRPQTATDVTNRSSVADTSFRGPTTPVSPAMSDKPPPPPQKEQQFLRTPGPRSPPTASAAAIMHRPNSAIGSNAEFDPVSPNTPLSPNDSLHRQRSATPQPQTDSPTRPAVMLRSPSSGSHRREANSPNAIQTNIHIERSFSPVSAHSPGRQRPSTSPRSAHAANRAGRLFDAIEVERMRSVQEEAEPELHVSVRSPTDTPTSSRPSTASNSSPPHTPRLTDDETPAGMGRPESQISIGSQYDLDLSFIKTPGEDGEPNPRRALNRDSIASIDSVRTTCSADAVFNPRRRRWSVRSAVTQPPRGGGPDLSLSVHEEDDCEYYDCDDDDVFDDACSYLEDIDAFPPPPLQIENFMQRRPSLPESVGSRRSSLRSCSSVPPSPTCATASDAGHGSDSLAVKIKYDDCVVAVRIPHGTTMAALRARLLSKFQQAQGIKLQPNFSILYAPSGSDALPIVFSSPSETKVKQRPVTTATLGGPFARHLAIRRESDWDAAVASCHGKLTLHILNTDLDY